MISMRVLVVEDDRQITDFLERALSEAGFKVDVAWNGPQGFELALKESYDAIIIDVILPVMDGLEILQKLRNRGVLTPVLILSAKGSVSDRVSGLELGGDDYLTKPFELAELLARLWSLIRRSKVNQETVQLKAGDLWLDLVSRRVFRGDEEFRLLPQEFALLEYLMRNKGRVVTRAEILENVWGYNFVPSTNVVEVHICRLREKLERPNKPKLLQTFRKAGYALVEDPSTGGDDS
jgi:two-component system, OmpR family, response regulator